MTENNSTKIQTTDDNKKLAKLRNDAGIGKVMAEGSIYGRKSLFDRGSKQLEKMESADPTKREVFLTPSDPAYQLSTLFEFENGNLLVNGCGLTYRALALEMSQQLQAEYRCTTQSEKATAHLAAQNFIRTLELQKDLSNILNAESYNDMKLRRYQVISKAYDQANRQYLMTIQTLQMMRQPAINVNIKANTANIANQQMIKQDNYEA